MDRRETGRRPAHSVAIRVMHWIGVYAMGCMIFNAERKAIFNAERKALQVMGLGSDATLETVKAKYKALVKQHHPDANGGDRSTEDRLIEIIKAYNYLKTVVRAG
jgi:DnaJ-domain-containing protein 1